MSWAYYKLPHNSVQFPDCKRKNSELSAVIATVAVGTWHWLSFNCSVTSSENLLKVNLSRLCHSWKTLFLFISQWCKKYPVQIGTVCDHLKQTGTSHKAFSLSAELITTINFQYKLDSIYNALTISWILWSTIGISIRNAQWKSSKIPQMRIQH